MCMFSKSWEPPAQGHHHQQWCPGPQLPTVIPTTGGATAQPSIQSAGPRTSPARNTMVTDTTGVCAYCTGACGTACLRSQSLPLEPMHTSQDPKDWSGHATTSATPAGTCTCCSGAQGVAYSRPSTATTGAHAWCPGTWGSAQPASLATAKPHHRLHKKHLSKLLRNSQTLVTVTGVKKNIQRLHTANTQNWSQSILPNFLYKS